MGDRMETRPARATHMRKHTLVVAVSLVAAIAALGAPAPALAGLQQELAVFAECPVNVPNVARCAYSKVTGGEFTLGGKTVAIGKTVVLQGGLSSVSPDLVPAANGETLSRTPLTVPGGLVGIEGLGGEVTATAELAGPVALSSINLLNGNGTAASLPLMVKLGNPLLGESCYIGSESDPVEVQLTTGTTSPPSPNRPITGSPGHFSVVDGGRIELIADNSLVGNSFSVPGANGCGGLLSLLIDPAVDLSAGIPAAAGHNTAIMNGTLEVASASEVEAQLALPEIGRCEIAESVGEGKEKVYKGLYENRGCTVEEVGHEGKYEWLPGPGVKREFTSAGAKATLESVNGAKVLCSGSSIEGEYTGPKTASAVVTLSGCKRSANDESCQSPKAATGEIVSSPLTGRLGLIEDLVTASGLLVSVGFDLGAEPSLLTAECAGAKEALVVKGSVIAPIGKANRMSSSFSLKYRAKVGRQEPEQFEGAPPDTLVATMGFGSEQAGLTASAKFANQEQLEIKTEHSN